MARATVTRDISEYVGGREVRGTTVLSVPMLADRRVHLWSLDDELLLILELGGEFVHFESTCEPLEGAIDRGCDWLTEPPSVVT